MAPVDQFSSAGFDNVQWAYRGSNGIMVGTDNLATTDTGSSSSMARLLGANAAPISVGTPTVVDIQGDNTVIETFQFRSGTSIQFQLTVTVSDFNFDGAISNSTVYDLGDWAWSAGDPENDEIPPMVLLLSRNAKSKASGAIGAKMWEHVIIPNAQVTFVSTDYTFQGAAQYIYNVIASPVDVMPDGRTVTSLFGKPTIKFHRWTSPNRVSMSALVGDGTADDVVLANQPIAVANTKATVETTGFALDEITAVDTTDPFGATLTTAPASGKYAVVMYEFDDFS